MTALLLDPAEFFGAAAIQDPYPFYNRLREAGPVHRVGDSGFYLVCDWAAITEVAVGFLAANPELQGRLREHPELMGVFVEETLRMEPPFRAHYRHVLRDTELAGVAVPAGSRVLLLWGAANRDPEHFEDPDEFRLDRPNTKGHMSFGRVRISVLVHRWRDWRP